MKVKVRLARISDLKNYTNLLQRTYEAAYTQESLGLTKNCFSKKVFNTKNTQDYLKSKLQITDQQKTWLAFVQDEMIGSITISDNKDTCELSGLYIAPEYQGKGIGKRLYSLALEFSGTKNITLDIYQHNKNTISIYKKWGFEIDKNRGSFSRHWPEWPKGLEAKCIYMILRKKR